MLGDGEERRDAISEKSEGQRGITTM